MYNFREGHRKNWGRLTFRYFSIIETVIFPGTFPVFKHTFTFWKRNGTKKMKKHTHTHILFTLYHGTQNIQTFGCWFKIIRENQSLVHVVGLALL